MGLQEPGPVSLPINCPREGPRNHRPGSEEWGNMPKGTHTHTLWEDGQTGQVCHLCDSGEDSLP